MLRLVKAHLEQGRTTKATIKLGREVYEFVQAFAKDNGLDPSDVMVEAVNVWHKKQLQEIDDASRSRKFSVSGKSRTTAPNV